MKNDDSFDYEDDHIKSKTQVKKEMHALQTLGGSLVNLSQAQLDKFNLSETFLYAIAECKKIKSNSALKRQKQFIGKLIRKEDIEHIEQQLNEITQTQHKEVRQQHLVEGWRDKLIDTQVDHIQAFITQYPQCDRQQLRQLTAKARQEQGLDKPPANTRKLFKFIRETMNTPIEY